MKKVTDWTVIFLVDQDPPSKIILLKRSAKKVFAPNFYVGIGGKVGDIVGFESETPLESAYRELAEETENNLTIDNITLYEFARCLYDSGLTLHYFWGMYKETKLPKISANDGTVEWVETDTLLDLAIIPTTKLVCAEWKKRGFNLNNKFTIYVSETGTQNTVRLVKLLKVADGLR